MSLTINNEFESGGKNINFNTFCFSGALRRGSGRKRSFSCEMRREQVHCSDIVDWVTSGNGGLWGNGSAQREPIVFPVAEPGRSVCVRLLNCRRQTVLCSSRHLVQTLSAPVRRKKKKANMNVCSWGLLLRESRLMLCPSFAVQAGLLLCQQQAAVAPYGPCMPQIRYLFTQLINGILNRFIFESLTFRRAVFDAFVPSCFF